MEDRWVKKEMSNGDVSPGYPQLNPRVCLYSILEINLQSRRAQNLDHLNVN